MWWHMTRWWHYSDVLVVISKSLVWKYEQRSCNECSDLENRHQYRVWYGYKRNNIRSNFWCRQEGSGVLLALQKLQMLMHFLNLSASSFLTDRLSSIKLHGRRVRCHCRLSSGQIYTVLNDCKPASLVFASPLMLVLAVWHGAAYSRVSTVNVVLRMRLVISHMLNIFLSTPVAVFLLLLVRSQFGWLTRSGFYDGIVPQ